MLEYLSIMTKRNEKLDEIEKEGVKRSRAVKATELYKDLFDLRMDATVRDLVGME